MQIKFTKEELETVMSEQSQVVIDEFDAIARANGYDGWEGFKNEFLNCENETLYYCLGFVSDDLVT